MNEGFIYILSNEILKDNLLKIGRTKRTDSKTRSKQLSSSTSIPNEFKLEKEFKFYDVNKYEKIIHLKLSDYRFKKNKEFFTCDINLAEQIIKSEMISDLNDYIKSLTNKYEILNNKINSTDFIANKWSDFFQKLEWDFIPNIEQNSNYSFVLNTKYWDVDGENYIVYDDRTLVFISNKYNFDEISEEELSEIEKYSSKNIRVILIFKTLLNIEFTKEIYLGYTYFRSSWEQQRILKYPENKFGLFTDTETWFDFIAGKFIKREDLQFAEKEILEHWK